jgi:uroporphyrinogen-III synthase
MSCWLVTRPADDAARLAESMAGRGHQAVIAPMFEIDYSTPEPIDLTDVQALLFTSANGVRGFVRMEPRRHLPVFTVGDATARQARAAGFGDVTSAGGDVGDLARVAGDRLDPAAGTLFHAAGKQTAGNLKGMLERTGFAVRRAVLYRARPVPALPAAAAAALRNHTVDGALFFSPRTAEVFDRLVRAAALTDRLQRLAAMCLSAAVARRLDGGTWGAVRIAERPEASSLLALLDIPICLEP